jgi:hypothetical protein
MGNITSGHFIFIPVVLAIGFVFGFIVGGRAARDAYQMELKREEERKKAKEDRAARRGGRAAEEGSEGESKQP